MIDDDVTRAYIEMWKVAVDVQKHFNDIELRIRSLALTVLTFALGGAAVAVKDGQGVQLAGQRILLGTVILFAGLLVWLAFYFVDQVWYHRLLVGAVNYAKALEGVLRETLPYAGLTEEIGRNSPYTFGVGAGRWKKELTIHSRDKIRIFYFSISLVLIGLAGLVQIGAGGK